MFWDFIFLIYFLKFHLIYSSWYKIVFPSTFNDEFTALFKWEVNKQAYIWRFTDWRLLSLPKQRELPQ